MYKLDVVVVCSSFMYYMYVLVVGSNASYTRYQGSTSFMCYILVVRTSCVY